MPDFGELLSSHISRSGISDADLARRIGVSRPTLIRWKEGVTTRPRYREDVLSCAEVLRLTPEERDELLVAADFDPEAPPPPAVSTEPADVDMEVPPAVAVSSPAPPRRRRRLPVVITVGVLSAMATITVALVLLNPFSSPDEPDHPVAEAGESLIVIAPFANYTAGQLAFNIRGRLRASLDREIAAARLGRIRTVDWPEELSGHQEALMAARDSRAAIVIWGEYDSARVLANLTSAATESESLGPQVVDIAASPSDLPAAINIDLAPEVRAVALLTLSQLYLQRDEYDLAKTVLIQALAEPPSDPAALANLRYRLGQAYLGGKYADLDEAIWRFTQVLSVQPRSSETYSSRGLAYLERGRPGDAGLAIADLTRASNLAPHLSAPYLNRAAAYAERGHPGDLDRALRDLEWSIDAGAEGAGVFVNRAAVYLERGHDGDLDRAFEDLDRAMDIDPDLATAWINRGSALLARNNDRDVHQAEADFTKAIELAPDSAAGYYNRALVRSEAEEWELSNADLLAAQERDPRNPAINGTLCWQLAVQRRPEAALPYCNLALESEPDGLARDSRGLVYAVMGKTDEAIADFSVFLDWVEASAKPTCAPYYRPSRETWIRALRSGDDPFDDETLHELRLRPVSPGGAPC